MVDCIMRSKNVIIVNVLFSQGHFSPLARPCRRKTMLPIWYTSSLTSTPAWVSSSRKTGCWPQLTATYRECRASPPPRNSPNSSCIPGSQVEAMSLQGTSGKVKIVLVVTTDLGVGGLCYWHLSSEQRPGRGRCGVPALPRTRPLRGPCPAQDGPTAQNRPAQNARGAAADEPCSTNSASSISHQFSQVFFLLKI